MTSKELTILLIEDDHEAAERMCQLLKKIDTKKFSGKNSATPSITVATNQNDADRAILESPASGYDIILLDLKYPGRDGEVDEQHFEGMKWLGALRSSQVDSAIAIQTAFPYDDQLKSAVTALRDFQADEFIPKGINWPNTEARLAAAWEKAQARRYTGFLQKGYKDFLHSRVFRAVAEDARDEVYRRSTNFRNVASQLESGGWKDAAETILREYNALIDEVVDITTPVEDASDHQLEDVSSSSLLEGLRLFYSEQCARLRNPLSVFVDCSEGIVRTYDRDLRTALHELIENAVEAVHDEAAKRGHKDGFVKLSSRLVSEPRAGLEITISDNGPGFPPEVLRNPFQRGFSTKEMTGRPFRGMGLYVALRFMNRIFGSVKLNNKPSQEGGALAVLFVPDLGVLAKQSK